MCVIYCSKANKAALSLSINAGHFNDPNHCPGLAHLFEHMMFATSEFHAKGNDLHALVTQNRGYVNAWTSSQHTNFHLDCASSVFLQANRQLIDMLLNPLYSEQTIEQEVCAIDAEFKMRLKDDVRRLYDVHKETVNPIHPFHRFTIGNSDTFDNVSIDQLKSLLTSYHQQYLRGSNIKVTIVHPMISDKEQRVNFEQCLTEQFESFKPNNDDSSFQHSRTQNSSDKNEQLLQNNADKYPLYLKENLQKRVLINPVKDTKSAIATFVLPSVEHFYQFKPLLLLSHLLEDTAQGTLARHLIDMGWITDLTASSGICGHNYQEFSINLKLTDHGCENLDLILSELLSLLSQLAKEPIEAWRLKEKSRQLYLQVASSETPAPIDEAINIASRLHEDTFANILDMDTRLDTDNIEQAQQSLQQVLSHFVVQNLRVFDICKRHHCSTTTKTYKVPYQVLPLNLQSAPSNKQYLLSKPNPYMPTNSVERIQTKQQSEPLQCLNNTSPVLWYAYDSILGLHRADTYISISHAQMVGSAVNVSIKKMWLAMLKEYLELEFGHAEYAGLHFTLYGHQAGVTLHVSGLSDRQSDLSLDILGAIKGFVPNKTSFENARNKMQVSVKNAQIKKPINVLFFELNCYFQQNTFAHNDVLLVLEKLLLSDVIAKHDSYFEHANIEILCAGKISKTDALTLRQSARNIFSINEAAPSESNIRAPEVRKATNRLIKNNLELSFTNSASDAACICYFQAPDCSTQSTVLAIMLEKLLSALIFDGLRNKRKLGYVAGCGFIPINNHPGLALYCQSPSASAAEIKQHILQELGDIIDNTHLSQRRVSDLIETLKEQFRLTPTNQSQYAQQLWMSLDSDNPSQKDSKLLEEFDNLSLTTVNQALNDLKNQQGYQLISLLCDPINE